MIVTRKKETEVILGMLKGYKSVFLIGCAQCATMCKTGGEQQLCDMQALLEAEGKVATGKAILDPACHLVKVKQFAYQNKDAIKGADAILALTCGDGVQAIKDGIMGKTVLPALDTLFLGEFERGGHFSQKCVLCGECIIDKTDAICPITMCAKGLLNGPCGGSKNKKCEVDREKDCAWILIYERLKVLRKLENMEKIACPRDYSLQSRPQKVIV
ncbi:MAG: methylenetetrahydrofolate reductase C-terminal domain-containing protein [Candidatus Omnitrophica bacterium]|nr:methylenetetrahydrofolate reductase C-terminal domain-containing protein [Candidatus Omnitrophota bacterium]